MKKETFFLYKEVRGVCEGMGGRKVCVYEEKGKIFGELENEEKERVLANEVLLFIPLFIAQSLQ